MPCLLKEGAGTWEDNRGLTKAAHFSLRWKCSKGENTGGSPVTLLRFSQAQ